MLRQYGRRGTIAVAVAAFITILALLNILQPFRYEASQPQADTRIEETTQLEQDTFQAGDEPAEALIDGAKAALEKDAAKSEEEKQAEAIADAKEVQATQTWPGREFPPPEPTSGISKVVVMGKTQSEDTTWVHQLHPDWQSTVYCVDLPPDVPCPATNGLKTPLNKAKEALPYLTYIIEHYARLPDVMAFVHAHRSGMPAAWHNDAPRHDAVRMLRDLRVDTVLERGYVNLRCIPDIGCPDEVQPFRSPPNPERHAEHAFPYFYAHFFNATFEQMQEEIPVVATPCCAQFAVSRAQVLQRELGWYEGVRDFLVETEYEDDVSGRVMEYMWHMMFGRGAVSCEELFEW